jgi:hypothetical protein
MKIPKLKINGKEYQPAYGMELMEWLGKQLKTDEIGDIINHFVDIQDVKKLSLKHIPKFALLVRGAVFCGCGVTLTEKEVKDWCFSNAISASGVLNSFASFLPGQGESDKELLGNLKALQEGAEV